MDSIERYQILEMLHFAKMHRLDPELSAADRELCEAFFTLSGTPPWPDELLYGLLRKAHRTWKSSGRDTMIFRAVIDPSSFIEAVYNKVSVLISAESATGAVRVDGNLVSGYCQHGCGSVAVPVFPILAMNSVDSIVIDARRGHFNVSRLRVPANPDESFDYQGNPWTPPPTPPSDPTTNGQAH